MGNEVKTTFVADKKPHDRVQDQLERDLKRFDADRLRAEKSLTDQITRQADQQYRARVSAQRKATQDILAELKKEERERDRAISARSTVVGGAAIAAVAGAVVVSKELLSVSYDLGKASVQLAANFEQTRAAMTVFAGGASAAKEELKQLSDLSRRTPGLGLVDAEQGATRLRALGFTAATTQQLLEGLAKQKILSGVGSEAIDRVTLNLAQLSTGSGDFQDIKDLVTNLPTVRKEIVATFGSLQDFQAALKDDPTRAIERFASALSAVQAPAGGANDAFAKLTDEFTRMGRTLGEPILDPLTRDVKSLTDTIGESTDRLARLAQTIADAYQGASVYVQALGSFIKDLDANTPGWVKTALDFPRRATAFITTGGVSEFTPDLTATGEGVRRERAGQNSVAGGLQGDISGILRAEKQQLKESEDAVKQSYDIRQSITENYYKLAEARVAVSGRTEEAQIKSLAALRNQSIQQQIRELSDYFQKAVKVAKDKESLDKLSASYVLQRGKLETELGLNNLETERKLIDLRKKQADERKKEAEKAQKEAEQLQKTILGIFDNVAQGNSNPYIKFLTDSEKFSRSLLDVTKGLTAEQREFLKAQNASNIARERSEQRAAGIVDAFNLRTDARDFRRGYRLTGQAFINEENRDLSELFSKLRRGKLTQEAYDKAVIDLTRSSDPRALTQYNRFEAAAARERQAKQIATQEKNANDFYTEMRKLINDGGLKVQLSDDSSHLVTVIDESDLSNVTRQSKPSDTAGRRTR